jgi:uncharacterized phage infection (PIP) family protein YhgE
MTITELEPEPQEYQDALNTTVEQFLSVLDDFKKYYIFTNKNPEVDEYQNYYLENKSQLQNLNKDVFLIRNDIETKIAQLNYIITRLNSKLSSEKELKGELSKIVSNLKQDGNGSNIMLDETSFIYNNQYLLNIELLFGIFGTLYLLFFIFKNKKTTT